MAVCNAVMPSYTYAMKAERLLRSRGYSCEIVRRGNTSDSGCGFSLRIKGDCGAAAEILKSYSVPVTAVTDGGA